MKFKNVTGKTLFIKLDSGIINIEKDKTIDLSERFKRHPGLEEVKEVVKSSLDLNNDGKIDKQDSKIASKVMNAVKKKKSKKKKAKK